MENENEKYQCYLKSLEEERKETSVGYLTMVFATALIIAGASFKKWVENKDSSEEKNPIKIEEKAMPVQEVYMKAKEHQQE